MQVFRLDDISRKIAFEIGNVLAFLKSIIERNIVYKCSVILCRESRNTYYINLYIYWWYTYILIVWKYVFKENIW